MAAPLASALREIDRTYEIHRVANLRQAVRSVESERFDAALVDLTLPDADNCDVAYALGSVAPDLPLVALTGRDFESVGLSLARAGVQDYLQKGVDSIVRVHRTLLLAIERQRQKVALRRSATDDELAAMTARTELETHVERAVCDAHRGGSIGAFVLLDADDFGQLDAGGGQRISAAVLKTILRRLTAIVRVGDRLGRINGEQFAALADGLEHRDDADRVADTLRAASCCTVKIADRLFRVTTSVAVSAERSDRRGH